MQRIDKANDAKAQEPKLFRPYPGMNKNSPMPPKETFSLIPDENVGKQTSATSISRRASLRGALDIKLANFPALSGPTSANTSPTRGSPGTSSISSVDFKISQSFKDDKSKTSSPSGSFASVGSLKALAEESIVGPETTTASQSGLIIGRQSAVSRKVSAVREAGRIRSVSTDSKNNSPPFHSITKENEEHYNREDDTTARIGKVSITGTQIGTDVNRDSSQGTTRVSSILKRNRTRRATVGAKEDTSVAATTVKRSNTTRSDTEEEESVKSANSIESRCSRTGTGNNTQVHIQKRTATVLALMGGIDKGSFDSEEFKLSKTQKDTMSELLGLGLYVD